MKHLSSFIVYLSILASSFLALASGQRDLDNEPNHNLELCSGNTTCSNEKSRTMKVNQWEQDPRLASTVVPESYDLTLHPNIPEGLFTGHEVISVELKEPRNNVYLHSQDLNITKATFTSDNGTQIAITNSFKFERHNYWVLEFDKEAQPGMYKIGLEFNGSLTGKIVGFYISKYHIASTDEWRSIVTTKFEPTHARQAFPCFDEPNFKAKFDIKLVRPKEGYFALSNMNVKEELEGSPSAEWTTTVFHTSPPMATYLACFIVCDFEKLDSGVTSSGTTITVYAQPGKASSMKFARDLTVSAMDYYTELFGIPYSLPKLDLIAIPDFVSGAMENWGLVTFRETQVLFKEGVTSVSNLRAVANTVVHELAHMWFGDLVTMEWWNDLWLNEGFATFQASVCLQRLQPEWEVAVDDLSFLYRGLEEDGRTSSHPIIQTANNPDQITEMFDFISYLKGSSILRMMAELDLDSFTNGVRSYLKKYQYQNAVTEDLWAAVQQYYKDINVSEMMGTWTRQMGYPLVQAKKEGDELVFTQHRFLEDPGAQWDPESSPFGYKWDIPIKYFIGGDPKTIHSTYLLRNQSEVRVKVPAEAAWFKANWKHYGFYRVNYTLDNWNNLGKQLKEDAEAIPWPEDRAELLEDAFALAYSGYISYEIPLSLIGYLKTGNETKYAPWPVASKHLGRLNDKLQYSPEYSRFQKFAQDIIEPKLLEVLSKIHDLSNQDIVQRSLMSTVFSLGCVLKSPSALTTAKQIFNDWIEGKTDKPNPDIRSAVYSHGMSEEKWEKLWQMYLNETEPQEKANFRLALTHVQSVPKLERLLELAKNEDYVRSQDYLTVLVNMASNKMGTSLVWNFVRNEWDFLVQRYTLNDRYLGQLIRSVTSSFDTAEKLKELQDFLAAHPEEGAGRASRKNALEKIQINIKWAKQNLPQIEKWLKGVSE